MDATSVGAITEDFIAGGRLSAKDRQSNPPEGGGEHGAAELADIAIPESDYRARGGFLADTARNLATVSTAGEVDDAEEILADAS